MLKGKTVIVTGAAKGIGKAIALRFAKEGCNIVLNYRSNVDDSVISEIKAQGVECMPYKADVSKFEDAEKLIKDTKDSFGSVEYFNK